MRRSLIRRVNLAVSGLTNARRLGSTSPKRSARSNTNMQFLHWPTDRHVVERSNNNLVTPNVSGTLEVTAGRTQDRALVLPGVIGAPFDCRPVAGSTPINEPFRGDVRPHAGRWYELQFRGTSRDGRGSSPVVEPLPREVGRGLRRRGRTGTARGVIGLDSRLRGLDARRRSTGRR
jgi:hypothetical protein